MRLASFAKRITVMCGIFLFATLAGCQNRDVAAEAEAASALAMLEQNRIAEARIAINRAITLRDDVADYHITRGRIEITAGAYSAAFDAYSGALALDASNLEALHAVSQLGLQTGNIRASLEATETLLLLNPSDLSALLARGLHALLASRLEEADGYAGRMFEIDPLSEEASILRARILFLKGENQNALETLARYSDARPASSNIHLITLEIFRAARNAQGMETQFELLRESAPDNRQLKLDEANFLFKTDRPMEAIAMTVALLRLPDLRPDEARDVLDLWNNWSVREIPPQAISDIETSATAYTKYSTAVFLAHQNQLPAARQLAGSLEGNEKKSLSALLAQLSGRTTEAARLVNLVLADDPTHCLALSVQARIRLDTGEPRAALANAQQAATQCPAEAEAWSLAAQAYGAMNDMENARRMWRQGGEANPQDAQFVTESVDWLLRQGSTREAMAIARRLTRDAPALVRGWEFYRNVCSRTGDPCRAEAERGLADARTRYWIDYEPGEAPPRGLFGRLRDS